MKIYLAIIAVTILAVSQVPTLSGQISGDQECLNAAKWHRQTAMKWSVRESQEYHLNAAESADELAKLSGACAGWQADSTPPAPTTRSQTA